MRNPDIRVYFVDMLNFCVEILALVETIPLDAFLESRIHQLAAERLFETLGEAANRIPREEQDKFDTIPWHKIIGLRNVIAHSYEIVEPDQLYHTMQYSIAELHKELLNITR